LDEPGFVAVTGIMPAGEVAEAAGAMTVEAAVPVGLGEAEAAGKVDVAGTVAIPTVFVAIGEMVGIVRPQADKIRPTTTKRGYVNLVTIM